MSLLDKLKGVICGNRLSTDFDRFSAGLSLKERDSIRTVTYSLPSRSDDVIAHHHPYHHNESGCGRVPVWQDSQRITCPTTKAATIIQQTFIFEKNSGYTSIIRTQRWLPSCNCCNCLFREASLSWYILQWNKPRLVSGACGQRGCDHFKD